MPRAVGLEVLACPAAGYASSPRSPTRGASGSWRVWPGSGVRQLDRALRSGVPLSSCEQRFRRLHVRAIAPARPVARKYSADGSGAANPDPARMSVYSAAVGNLPAPRPSRAEDTPLPEAFDQLQEKPSCHESKVPFLSTLTSHVLNESIVPLKSLGKSANLSVSAVTSSES